MNNRLAQEVEKILSEELGEFIAQATLKKGLEQIGCTADKLTGEQLPELAERLEKSVNFFAGSGKGAPLADRIRALKN